MQIIKQWVMALALLAPGTNPGVDALGWMAGVWVGEQDGVQMEEHWMPPQGGCLLGIHRDVAGGRTVSFEFMRIAEDSDGRIAFWGSPMGRPAIGFQLVESKDRRAVFENPEHDFPQRILYWLAPDGRLHARIEDMKGEHAQEWSWRLARPLTGP